MNRLKAPVALGALAVGLAVGMASPASAVTTAGSPAQAITANPPNPTGVAAAASAHASANKLRRDVGQLLNHYLAEYGDRLNASEKARMRFLVKDADRQLGIVDTKTASTQRVARSGASRASVYRTAKAAELAFTTAQASSLATLDEVQPMLQSKLGLFEALSAKGDLDEQMARYDALGEQIRSVSAAYAP